MAKQSPKAFPVVQNRIVAMQAGFQKDFTPKQSLPVDGQSMAQQAILGQLGTFLKALTDVEDTRAALAQKVVAKAAAMPEIHRFLSDLEASLKQALGAASPLLQDFGIAPPRAKKKLTAEQKALMVASAKGTKKARGIIGKNQRKQITTSGKPGLVLVDPTGNAVPGLLAGPTPPGSRLPLNVLSVSTGDQGSANAGSPAAGAGAATSTAPVATGGK